MCRHNFVASVVAIVLWAPAVIRYFRYKEVNSKTVSSNLLRMLYQIEGYLFGFITILLY